MRACVWVCMSDSDVSVLDKCMGTREVQGCNCNYRTSLLHVSVLSQILVVVCAMSIIIPQSQRELTRASMTKAPMASISSIILCMFGKILDFEIGFNTSNTITEADAIR